MTEDTAVSSYLSVADIKTDITIRKAAIIRGDLANISVNWTCGPFFHETFTGKINRGAPRMFSREHLGGGASGEDIFAIQIFYVAF